LHHDHSDHYPLQQAARIAVLEEQLPENASERIWVCVPPKKGDGPKVYKDVAECIPMTKC
jgi:hypothetical protein